MGGRFKQLRPAACWSWPALAVLAAAAGGAAAGERLAYGGPVTSHERAAYIAVGEATRAPIGWVEFCISTSRNATPSRRRRATWCSRAKAWSDMVKVNDWANDNIKPITDLEHWGVVERWNYPDDGYGDCEDYVLLKRRMLMQAGWPREALLITVVRDKKGDGHAVLTVKTNRGEFILDNQESQILAWNKTGYRFVKRQSQSDPNVWVALGEPHAAPATVSAR